MSTLKRLRRQMDIIVSEVRPDRGRGRVGGVIGGRVRVGGWEG